MSAHAASVRSAYRELLRLISRLPASQAAQQLQEARAAMRAHQLEADPGKQQDLFKQLAAKISFLRVITPRRPGQVSAIGTGRFVLRDGKLVEGGAAAAARVADGKISMEEARQRHDALLQRQHFGRPPPRYDPSTF